MNCFAPASGGHCQRTAPCTNGCAYVGASRPGCPRCAGEQNCPCSNCIDDNAGKVLWEWIEGGEVIKCGHCGYAAHADHWMDLEGQFYDRRPAKE